MYLEVMVRLLVIDYQWRVRDRTRIFTSDNGKEHVNKEPVVREIPQKKWQEEAAFRQHTAQQNQTNSHLSQQRNSERSTTLANDYRTREVSSKDAFGSPESLANQKSTWASTAGL